MRRKPVDPIVNEVVNVYNVDFASIGWNEKGRPMHMYDFLSVDMS